MFRNVFSTIEGVNIFPIIVMILFIAFFVVVVIMAVRMDGRFSDYMSNIPLDQDENPFKNKLN